MSKSVEKVCIYIDDSNLFIEGMKFMARQHGLVVKQDRRFRIDFSKLIEVLAKDRPILCKNLYGSGSLNSQSVLMAVKEEGIEPRVFDRCFKGREKEVDSTLAADVVDEAACLRFQPPQKLKSGSVTFIIVSGDRDYLEALRKVHKHGWKVEVVGWESSISERVRSYVENNQAKGAKLITLDQLIERSSSFYFLESRWSTPSEGGRPCYVFEYILPQTEDDARRLSFQVVNLIKRPCQYLRPDNDPRMIKIVMIVDYKNEVQQEKDTRNLIIEFQNGLCHRVSFQDNKDNEGDDLQDETTDTDDDEDGVEERCAFKFSCTHGKTCHCRHTRAEREHFEINSRHLGTKYKSQLCRNAQGRRCDHMKCPRRCPWAHGLREARCYFCDRGGLVGDHWMSNCPRTKHQQKLKLGDFIDPDVVLQTLTVSGKSLDDTDEQEADGSESVSAMTEDDSEYDSEL